MSLAELAARVTTAGGEREPLEIENPATGRLLATVARLAVTPSRRSSRSPSV